MKSLAGKIALVTGGARGIGAAAAKALAEQGATVALSYAKSKAEADQVVAAIEKSGGRAKAYQADQAKADQVKGLVASAVKDFGRIDILLNNAGVFDGVSIADTTDEMFDRTYAINVKAVFVATREALKSMPDGGRIINIGSVLGERAIFPGMTAYGMSKFAVAGMTRAWAWDLGARKITVNCVEPGPINTDMNPENSDWAEQQRKLVSLGRYGQPTEVGALVAFLASPAASFITGACIPCDGGMNA